MNRAKDGDIQKPAGPRPQDEPGGAPAWHAVSRGVAWFLGIYVMIQLAAELRSGSFGTAIWWCDLRPLSNDPARGILAGSAVVLVLFAAGARLGTLLRVTALSLVFLLFAAAVRDVAVFYHEAASRPSAARVPFAAHLA